MNLPQFLLGHLPEPLRYSDLGFQSCNRTIKTQNRRIGTRWIFQRSANCVANSPRRWHRAWENTSMPSPRPEPFTGTPNLRARSWMQIGTLASKGVCQERSKEGPPACSFQTPAPPCFSCVRWYCSFADPLWSSCSRRQWRPILQRWVDGLIAVQGQPYSCLPGVGGWFPRSHQGHVCSFFAWPKVVMPAPFPGAARIGLHRVRARFTKQPFW